MPFGLSNVSSETRKDTSEGGSDPAQFQQNFLACSEEIPVLLSGADSLVVCALFAGCVQITNIISAAEDTCKLVSAENEQLEEK